MKQIITIKKENIMDIENFSEKGRNSDLRKYYLKKNKVPVIAGTFLLQAATFLKNIIHTEDLKKDKISNPYDERKNIEPKFRRPTFSLTDDGMIIYNEDNIEESANEKAARTNYETGGKARPRKKVEKAKVIVEDFDWKFSSLTINIYVKDPNWISEELIVGCIRKVCRLKYDCDTILYMFYKSLHHYGLTNLSPEVVKFIPSCYRKAINAYPEFAKMSFDDQMSICEKACNSIYKKAKKESKNQYLKIESYMVSYNFWETLDRNFFTSIIKDDDGNIWKEKYRRVDIYFKNGDYSEIVDFCGPNEEVEKKIRETIKSYKAKGWVVEGDSIVRFISYTRDVAGVKITMTKNCGDYWQLFFKKEDYVA